jgi:hypothetical protein
LDSENVLSLLHDLIDAVSESTYAGDDSLEGREAQQRVKALYRSLLLAMEIPLPGVLWTRSCFWGELPKDI